MNELKHPYYLIAAIYTYRIRIWCLTLGKVSYCFSALVLRGTVKEDNYRLARNTVQVEIKSPVSETNRALK